MVICESPSCTERCPAGQVLSLTVATCDVLMKLPVPNFCEQVSTTGVIVQIFVCVMIGADVVLDDTGSEMLLGDGHE